MTSDKQLLTQTIQLALKFDHLLTGVFLLEVVQDLLEFAYR